MSYFLQRFPKIKKFKDGPRPLVNVEKLDQLFADYVATGWDVYIPSAKPPPCVDFDEEMLDSMGGFTSFLQAEMDRVNCKGSSSVSQEPPPKNTPLSKTTTSVPNKKQEVTAVTRLERGLIRVAQAYEKKCDLIASQKQELASQKQELDNCSITKCISLLN